MGERDDGPEFLKDGEWQDIVSHFKLSPREAEIVALVLKDRSEREIASQLGISTHTVHTYLERLYRKLAVRSRTQLVTSIFMAFVSMR
jgi:DNA-binding CsgD family transcriptional regulator